MQQSTELQNPINRVLCNIAAFFGTGIALIILLAFYDALATYSAIVMRVLTFGAITLILSVVAYVAVNVFLTLEYRAIENKIFKESHQELIISDRPKAETLEEKRERQVIELFDSMKFHNSISFNEIAREVFGQQSGVYTKQIKEILTNNGREF